MTVTSLKNFFHSEPSFNASFVIELRLYGLLGEKYVWKFILVGEEWKIIMKTKVEEKSWLDDGTRKEPNNDICHECKPFCFKSGHVEWPTCNSSEDGYCNGGNLPGMIQVGNVAYLQNYEWYEGPEDGDLKDEALK
uniref:Uncharacterized protein n=1 Tax=Tanacetum cinerariifolium TaxID=118510 RepID=A0A6L2LLR8_TANCI|nr:hypothetical protein [Tanacetum cinerariifolium]